VTILVNKEKPAARYSIESSAEGGSASGGDASNLSSGIYFYRKQFMLIGGQEENPSLNSGHSFV
jgi:hypothetical protein